MSSIPTASKNRKVVLIVLSIAALVAALLVLQRKFPEITGSRQMGATVNLPFCSQNMINYCRGRGLVCAVRFNPGQSNFEDCGSAPFGHCGNRQLDVAAGEACDDGNGISYDACVNCQPARCGDGVVRIGVERCENNSQCENGATCSNCQCVGGNCGNGRCDPMESPQSCPQDCRQVQPRCGDRNIDVARGEQCDDGNQATNDACIACRTARCGDGFIRTGFELCENISQCAGGQICSGCWCVGGTNVSSTPPPVSSSASRVSSTPSSAPPPAVCGNGVKEGTEHCDRDSAPCVSLLGSTYPTECTAQCRCQFSPRVCGNGRLEIGESCDGTLGTVPSGFRCNATCNGWVSAASSAPPPVSSSASRVSSVSSVLSSVPPPAVCGNGTVDASTGEQCNDRNTTAVDGCGPTCRYEFCGDGVVQPPYEQCDDGNTRSGDGCTAWCERG